MIPSSILIILTSILMSSTAHVVLKKGMMTTTSTAGMSLLATLWNTATNLWIISGMLLHVGALIVWLWALSRVDITFAYPFLALGYVLVSLMAWFWLGESLSVTRITGMGLIITGLLVLSRGG